MFKLWDVNQPTDAWEAQYARLEYARVGLYMVGAQPIDVTYMGFTDSDDPIVEEFWSDLDRDMTRYGERAFGLNEPLEDIAL